MSTLPCSLDRLGQLTLIAVAVWPRAAFAQSMLSGRVTGSGRLLANAELTIGAREVHAHTTDAGTYRVVISEVGLVRVSVRAVGFYPASRRFVLIGNDTVVADFSLAPAAQTLDSITVTASASAVPGKMQGFEERRHLGFGHFYTREFLAERETSTLANVLRLTNNLELVRRPIECGGGFAVATGRSGAVQWEPWMSCSPQRGRGSFLAACYSPIYLDGALYWGPGMPGVPPPDVDQLKVLDLEGIEVYRSGSEIPIQYQVNGSGCGVVLLWTRVGGR